jgi:hypothetical protein
MRQNGEPGWGSGMKRPKRARIHYPNKPKALDASSPVERLEEAAVNAKYTPSDYHCSGPKGQPPKRRTKPTMHCPRNWTRREAIVAIRHAIRSRHVSRRWTGGFPRHLWYGEGDVWYEARTNDGTPGVYHAYPVEIAALPAGLER